MTISDTGISFITYWEGERLALYKDSAGKDTIGVGHLVLPGEDYSAGISSAQSRALLRQDLTKAESLVNNRIRLPLSQNQYDALVSLAFNVPAAIVGGTVDDLINSRASEAAIRQVWGAYTNAGGRYIPGLANRRAAELNLYFNKKKTTPIA